MTDHAASHNRLADETSPYLLQHKTNPVDWWPWSPAALAEARRTQKPILLSVGYAACHWCHVMAHESFEDEATAAVMNELFVNIKVDREERPDIDQIYMNALHLLGEQGGWPLTMFLNSDGEPFWGGTYFPNVSRYGRPAFVDVLREVARIFREEPGKVAQNRDALLARLKERGDSKNASGNTSNLGVSELDQAAVQIARATDPVHGGLRGAPKFPQCTMLEFLWRAGARKSDARFFDAVDLALTRMSRGGIYDHLGGGYARYSVDERWLVPHFEKMLYDNAQILDLLALEFARSGNTLFKVRAAETVAWLAREMTTAEGAFASSLDADSEGEEGKFYVWSAAEVETVLGAENAANFSAAYDVTAEGNFEGHNILNQLNSLGVNPAPEADFAEARKLLQDERSKRVRPGLDDKVLADWNGLTIAALAQAAAVFGESGWLSMAERAFGFISTAMTKGDRLGHSFRDGKLLYPGLASDFAAMTRAALALFEATQRRDYLDKAIAWQGALERWHAEIGKGSYFLTAADAEGLVIRPHATTDDATPNHNGVIGQNLVRLAALTGERRFRDRADELLGATLPNAASNVFGHLSILNAFDMRLNFAEIVIAGEGEGADKLFTAALALPAAIRSVLRARDAATLPAMHPAQAKIAATQGAAAFVCRGETCSLPVTDVEAMRKLVLQI